MSRHNTSVKTRLRIVAHGALEVGQRSFALRQRCAKLCSAVARRSRHPRDQPLYYLADSRGRWEGHTLVVDTTNFNDKVGTTSYNCCGAAGEHLHIIERFTRIDENTIDYQYTVDDPTTFTRSWTVKVPMRRFDGPHL